ncbi:hypothetical protein [Defluviitalea phaphyphila]|uniref:hypothetical protein n=1 Tax=Defluviitalea phaphyphila TaxID=1473580 RepID=UPI000730C66C|nr:hypothetical protein [Defluviitalea phaphyphila]
MGCTRQPLIKKIIAYINTKINQFAVDRMVRRIDFDPAVVSFKMKEYGYRSFDEYARHNLFDSLKNSY